MKTILAPVRLLWMLALLRSLDGSAQFEGFVNHGLVGVGRVPSDLFDARGPGLDTLGGLFSAMAFDPSSWAQRPDGDGRQIFSGLLFAMPDRGFGDGSRDYQPRIQTLSLEIRPYRGAGPVPPTQIRCSNTASLLLTYGGRLFTGYDADSREPSAFPLSSTLGPGLGRRSLDPEGLALAPGGGFFVSDEYGPLIYRFDRLGSLELTLSPPAAFFPKLGPFPGTNGFTAAIMPTQGRRNNRGFEGLGISPDGKHLVAALQSPLVQDGGAGNAGRNTRLLVFDVDTNSPRFAKPTAEFVHQLSSYGTNPNQRHTPVSELLVLNHQTFLLLERDSLGAGSSTNLTPVYKRIVLVSTMGATDILNTGYDIEAGRPGQKSLPTNGLPSQLRPVLRSDFIDLLDTKELGRFGLNVHSDTSDNTLSEKWEGLTLMPMRDPLAPDDYLLLVGNDNDFKARLVYHNGKVVATNATSIPTMILAFHVTLPGFTALQR